jgi:hypothetical protein
MHVSRFLVPREAPMPPRMSQNRPECARSAYSVDEDELKKSESARPFAPGGGCT